MSKEDKEITFGEALKKYTGRVIKPECFGQFEFIDKCGQCDVPTQCMKESGVI